MPDMNLGARIKKRLNELGKKPMWLCSQVNGMSIGSLSALINRDSKKSEFASAIAPALGVSLDWLLTGDGEKLSGTSICERSTKTESAHAWPFETISRTQWESYPMQFRHSIETMIMEEAVSYIEMLEKHSRGFEPIKDTIRKSSGGK